MRTHRYMAFFMAVELVILLWAFGSLFGKRTVLEMKLDGADYYNGCAFEDGSLVIRQSDNEAGVSTASAGYGGIKLRPGRYEIKAVYSADMPGYDASKWSGASDLSLCDISVSSSTFIEQLMGNGLSIYMNTEKRVEPFWINSFTSCKDIALSISYQGYGDVALSSLVIEESVYFRFVRFIVVALIITGINLLCAMCFKAKDSSESGKSIRNVVLAIAAVTFFSSIPMFYRYIYVGHDFTFHIARISQIAEGIKSGNWLVKIEPDMINGYGYATPLFYPQLFLYIPALLCVAGFPLQTSYQIFIVLINLATTLIAYYSLVKVSDNRKMSVLGAFLYTFAPYRMSELYVAGRLGEILSMVFFPLIIYCVYSIYRDDEPVTVKKCIPLVLGVSGVLQSHLVSILFVGIFLAVFVLMNLKKTFKIRRLCYLAGSVAVVLMLNAWFIVPFIDSMDMDILVNNSGMLRFQGSGVYPIQVFALFYYGGGMNVPMFASGEFCLTMGVPLIIGICVFIWLAVRAGKTELKKDRLYRTGKINALFAVLTILFSLWIFPWDEINNISGVIAEWLAKVEFSWRFLSIGAAFAAFATVAGLCYVKRINEKLCKGAIIVMTALTLLSAGFFYADLSYTTTGALICSNNEIDDFALGVTNDYQLSGTDIDMCRSRSVDVSSDNLIVSDYSYEGGVTELTMKNTGTEGFEKVTLPLFSYPGYKAYDAATGEKYYIEAGQNKKIMVNVPAGYDGTVIVKYVEKPIWRVAETLSLVTLLALIVLKVCKRVK